MKILIVRFSSIGDVVLTTPVIRALKLQIPDSEIHYITKKVFKQVLEHNPHLDRLYTIEKSISEVLAALKKEKYDYVIDLHKNTRTFALKLKLGRPAYVFPKLNLEKWLLVNCKRKHMPDLHVVDRYFKAVEKLGVKNDQLPGEFYIDFKDEVNVSEYFGKQINGFISIAVGAQFATKRIPFIKLQEIMERIDQPIILVGGPTDVVFANQILAFFPNKNIYSACGNFNLAQSASIVKQSKVLLTNDTGMMHIAACFNVPIVSVWGNTVAEFGMYPYYPNKKEMYSIHGVSGLSCRPCSKIGFQKCPKGHFNCMQLQNSIQIGNDVLEKAKLFP